MNNIKKSLLLLAAGLMAVVLSESCSGGGNNTDQTQNVDSSDVISTTAYDEAKYIFYSLPSPVETALILEQLGIKYNDEYLSPASNVSRYNTQTSQALNLGIYSADLSFCALYEQNQAAIDYLAAVKKLSEQLGIMGFFNDSTIQKIQDNMNNKNKIVSIVSDCYTRSTNFLEEDERNEIASTVLVGGWVEGLYISLKMLETLPAEDNNIDDIVKNQKFTLDDMLGLLKIFSKNEGIAYLFKQMQQLKTIYDKVGTSKVDRKVYAQLTDKITEIRNEYIQ
ncbi:MAG: hypothetical protein II939_05445 [Bacteroidales bacterium]|jgi:hypothetical protein|nr:hypothetical protein [Bacteroidales bacterium]